MLFARLDTSSTYLPLQKHPIWEKALEALHGLDMTSELGTEWLIPERMYLNVHTYATRVREQCLFEGHRQMIDIQYMIHGGELIEWAIKADLQPANDYNASKDFQPFLRPDTATQLHLTSGHFAVFFPEDGHCPQIQDGKYSEVHKAVVKIDHRLFGESE